MPTEKKTFFNRKKSNSARVKEMSAISVINNSKFFRVANRRNSTSSVNMVNSTLINNFANSNNMNYNGYPRNSLNSGNLYNRSNGQYNGNQYGRRLSSGSALAATNVRRCQSMRQSYNGIFYDADEEIYDEDSRYRTCSTALSNRRSSQVDGGYHSNGSLTGSLASSDSYSSYTKYSNKDNPLSSIRIHIVDELPHCLENVYKVCILGTHNVGKSSIIEVFRECQMEQQYSSNNSKNIFHVSINFNKGDIGQFLDDISIGTHSDWFEETDSVISNYPADVYLVMYAVNDRDSFDEAKIILKELSKNNEPKLKSTILVANKSDLVRSRIITSQGRKTVSN